MNQRLNWALSGPVWTVGYLKNEERGQPERRGSGGIALQSEPVVAIGEPVVADLLGEAAARQGDRPRRRSPPFVLPGPVGILRLDLGALYIWSPGTGAQCVRKNGTFMCVAHGVQRNVPLHRVLY